MADFTFTRDLIETPRITMNVWTSGPEDGVPLLLVHGNLSTGGFWKYVAAELLDGVRVIAPDLRGFGRTEAKPVNATRGLGDMSDDVHGLLKTLGLAGKGTVNAAGWSMGAGVLQQLLVEHPEDLASLTLIAPVSPYGFGATKGAHGEPANPDFAGSGAAGVSLEFVRRIAAKDASEDDPATSPVVSMRSLYGPGLNTENVDEAFLIEELLSAVVGEDNYPGNATSSAYWPGLAPGERGVLNAMSPKWFNASAFGDSPIKPPITWIRGTMDQIVSDTSMLDVATLGSLGILPGWPGPEVAPSQPMDAQMHAVLERYRAGGGEYREVIFEGMDHGMPLAIPGKIAAEITTGMHRRPTA